MHDLSLTSPTLLTLVRTYVPRYLGTLVEHFWASCICVLHAVLHGISVTEGRIAVFLVLDFSGGEILFWERQDLIGW